MYVLQMIQESSAPGAGKNDGQAQLSLETQAVQNGARLEAARGDIKLLV